MNIEIDNIPTNEVSMLETEPMKLEPVVGENISDQDEDQWLDIIPFLQHKTEPFPMDVFPAWQRNFATALAIQNQVPLELAALLSLAVAAIPSAKMFSIQARSGWIEPLNLYTMAILESGNRKSSTEKELLAPVYDFEHKLVEEVRPSLEKSKHDIDLMKGTLDDLKKQYIRSRNGGTKTKTGKTPLQIKDEIESLVREIADIPEIYLPTILADDITMEKLVVLLSENNGTLGIFAAEGTLFGIAAGRYTGNASFDDLLKAHAGDPIKHDRIGRGRVDVPNPALTIGMCVQPVVLKQLATDPVFRLKGLQARFLYCIPESPLGTRQVNSPPIPEGVRNHYFNAIRQLLNMAIHVADKQSLILSPEANSLLIEFEQWLEPQLASTGILYPIVDWAAKLSGALLRVAGILHIADHCHESIIPPIVEVDTMARALRIQYFFISHAHKAFEVMDLPDYDINLCKKVLGWIDDQNGITEFSKRDLFCAFQSTFSKVEYLDPILKTLTEHGFIRKKKIISKGPGRPSEVFEINPLTAKYAINAKSDSRTNIADYADIALRDIKSEIEPIFWSELGQCRQEKPE